MKAATSNLVAIYARVSTERQEKEATIESQLAELHRRAEAEGWTVEGVYQDNGFSGSTLQRPELDRLRAAARERRFARVLILHPDRLARGKPYLRAIITDELASLGIPVVYLTYEVEDSAEGRVMDGMLSLFAEYEREKILDRTRRGLQHKIASGHIWRPRETFGYAYIRPNRPHEKHGHFEIVDDEAEIVRWMFDAMIGGMSTTKIAGELITRGIQTKQGGLWHATRVGFMLRNPMYSGQAAYNRGKACEPENPRTAYHKQRNSSVRQRPREEWKFVAIPAIVTPEMQAAAEAAIDRNRRFSTRNTKGEYLLAGLLVCGFVNPATEKTCGRHLMAQYHYRGRERRPTDREYRCTNSYHLDGAHHICKACLKAKHIEPLVWDVIKGLLLQPETLMRQMAVAVDDERGRRRDLERELEAAGAAVDHAQARLTKLLERNLAGRIDDATFDQMQPQLIAERTDAQERMEAARVALNTSTTSVTRWDDIRAFCSATAATLDELEQPEQFTRKQAVVRTLIQEIVAYPDHIQIRGILPCLDGDPDKRLAGGNKLIAPYAY
jgi:site-specific DNA recombinase